MNKKCHRILLRLIATVLLSADASTASFARQSEHHRVPDHHQPQSNRKREIEVNIPISGQHGGSNGHDSAATGQKTFKISPDRHWHVRPGRALIGSSFEDRNAIGLPIARREVGRRESVVPVLRLQIQPFRPPSNGSVNFTNRGFAAPRTLVPIRPSLPASSYGTVGGVSLIPRRTAVLGGPSTPAGGINGSAFMPKH